MQSDTARTLLVAVLCVLAIGAGASALAGTVDEGPSDQGLGSDDDGAGRQDDPVAGLFGGPGENAELVTGGLYCTTNPVIVYGGPLLVLGGALYLFETFRREREYWLAKWTPLVWGVFTGGLYAVVTTCTTGVTTIQFASSLAEDTIPPGTDVPSPAVDNPLLLLALLLALAAAVYVGVRWLRQGRTRPGDDPPGPQWSPDRSESTPPALAGVAAAAGDAADRIEADEHAAVDNEVYWAWREMTAHLDVDRPESSTPGEFAAAASAAGLDPEAVTELTELFEAVRYGDLPAESREDRALAVLRRIEDAAGEEAGGAAAADRRSDAGGEWRGGANPRK